MIRLNLSKVETPEFDAFTSEYEIASFVEKAGDLKRPSAAIASMLNESHPMYKGRGSNQVFRIQGYLMASLETYGLREEAVPIVLEALESSMSIYLVAAAAKAIRGMKSPRAEIVPYLIAALNNVYFRDDTVSFSSYAPRWPLQNPTTALGEIFKTLQWLAPVAHEAIPTLESWRNSPALNDTNKQALSLSIQRMKETAHRGDSCCELSLEAVHFTSKVPRKKLLNIGLEDQEGATTTYRDFFTGNISVLVFFYTRCDNPNKCSLTISKLARLQKILQEKQLGENVKTAAISYDPIYDRSDRLKLYGLQRHLGFDDNNKIFRVLEREKMPMLVDFFNSSVNYAGQLVNKHQVELYILDESGRPFKSFVRLQWDPQKIAEEIEWYLNGSPTEWAKFLRAAKTISFNIVVPFLIIFFPRCPVCWGVYMSLFGIAGMNSIPYSPWVLPLLLVFLSMNLYFLWRKAIYQAHWMAFGLGVLGSIFIVVFGPLLRLENMAITGIIFMVGASIMSNLSGSQLAKIKSFAKRLFQRASLIRERITVLGISRGK